MSKRLSEEEFDRLLALWADEVEPKVREWHKAQAERFRVPSTDDVTCDRVPECDSPVR